MEEGVTTRTAHTPAPSPTARSRARIRLERLSRPRTSTTNPTLEPLFALVRANHPRADLGIIERAYEVAELAHREQKRKSGEPYITHPLAVASILAGLGMPPDTLAAALLHDVVEDTGYPLADSTGLFTKGRTQATIGLRGLPVPTFRALDAIGGIGGGRTPVLRELGCHGVTSWSTVSGHCGTGSVFPVRVCRTPPSC